MDILSSRSQCQSLFDIECVIFRVLGLPSWIDFYFIFHWPCHTDPGDIAFSAKDTCDANLEFGQKKIFQNSLHAQGDNDAANIDSSLNFWNTFESVYGDTYQHTLVASHSMLNFLNMFSLSSRGCDSFSDIWRKFYFRPVRRELLRLKPWNQRSITCNLLN